MKKIIGLVAFLSIVLLIKANASFLQSLGFIAPQINGKSNVYDAQAGEIIYDSSDSTFYGHTHGSGWTSLSGGSGSTPTGTVLPYAGTTAPSGYLLANGAAVSRTTYASLFAVIGTSFGAGDGTTTFNLPDLRGRFVRGMDNGAGRDPNAATRTAMASGGNTGDNIGSVQADDIKSHSHRLAVQNLSAGGSGARYGDPYSPGTSTWTTGGIESTGGAETRPINIYLNYNPVQTHER